MSLARVSRDGGRGTHDHSDYGHVFDEGEGVGELGGRGELLGAALAKDETVVGCCREERDEGGDYDAVGTG